MQAARPAIAMDPKLFGKGRARRVDDNHPQRASVGDDLKLFATTFLAGFVVVSVLIA